MWHRSQRRRRSPSGCSGCLGGAGVPASHMSLGCLAVRTMALPRRRRLSPRVHHTSPHPARSQPDSPVYHSPSSTHTTHSHHRLPLAARIHARAPADTFLVPARSPRTTRPSRRPPRAARPLVRPTRTTTPWSPPAKALSTMSHLRCAQSLHVCGQKAASSPQVLLAKGTRVATAP